MEDRIRTLHHREPDVRPPLDIGDVLRTSFRLLRRHPALILGAATVLLIPSSVREVFRPVDVTPFAFARESPLYMVVLLVDMFVSPALVGGLAALVAVADHTARPVVAADALGRVATRLPSIVLANVLAGLAMVAGLVLCIVPGVVVALALAFVTSATAVEDTGPIAALSRSAELTKGIRVPMLGLMFVMSIPNIVTYVAIDGTQGADWMATAFASPTTTAMFVAQLLAKIVCVAWISLGTGVVYARAAIAPPETDVAEVASVFA